MWAFEHHGDLSGAKFARAKLHGADLRGARLDKANFRGVVLRHADLREASLKGANFSPTNPRGRLFRSTPACDPNCDGADLSGANLTYANLSGAILTDAILTGAGGHLCGEMARALGRAGCKVAVTDLRVEKAEAVAAQIHQTAATLGEGRQGLQQIGRASCRERV